MTQTHENPEQRVKSLLSILYFRWKSRRRKHSLAWFHLILPKSKKWSGLTPAPWLPQETNCDHTFGPVVQKHPETSVRQLEQRGRRRWCIWRSRSGSRGNSFTSLHLCRNAWVKVILRCNTWIFLCSSSPPGPPIVSEEELTCLALISPANTSQYSGSRVRALIQILQHQMDQQELVKEFMVCECVHVYSMWAKCLKLSRHLNC